MTIRTPRPSRAVHDGVLAVSLAFLVGGFALDLLAILLDIPELHLLAWYIIPAGILTALAAAVPRLFAFVSVPSSDHRARRRAFARLALSAAGLLVVAFAWWLRGGPRVPLDEVLAVLEGVGVFAWVGGGGGRSGE